MKNLKPKKKSSNRIANIIIFLLIGLLLIIYGSSLSCFQYSTFIKDGTSPNELCLAVVMWHNFNTLFIPAALTNDPRWIVAAGLIMWSAIVFFVVRLFRK